MYSSMQVARMEHSPVQVCNGRSVSKQPFPLSFSFLLQMKQVRAIRAGAAFTDPSGLGMETFPFSVMLHPISTGYLGTKARQWGTQNIDLRG